MKLFGVRIWPWHHLWFHYLPRVEWECVRNCEGGLTITINNHTYYTSDRAEERRRANEK
jgi:hypothetical protein